MLHEKTQKNIIPRFLWKETFFDKFQFAIFALKLSTPNCFPKFGIHYLFMNAEKMTTVIFKSNLFTLKSKLSLSQTIVYKTIPNTQYKNRYKSSENEILNSNFHCSVQCHLHSSKNYFIYNPHANCHKEVTGRFMKL